MPTLYGRFNVQLRPYQEEVRQKIYTAWAAGAQNVMPQLATGAGKTVLFTAIIAAEPTPTIAIAHRTELVSQISLTLARYGVRHNIIAQKQAVRNIIALHMQELGKSFYDSQAKDYVAGVDTLIRLDTSQNPWMQKIGLVVQDEGHHLLKDNKWGLAAAMFPKARGLSPTATPLRADGRGLGRMSDGLADVLIVGPSMRDLINLGYLTDYRIFAPPSDLDLSNVTVSASGDYSPPKLRTAVHKSHITGDVVSNYLKFAAGKLGITFAVDISAATEIAAEFRANNISCEVVSSHTPDLLRASIMTRFRKREILQIVNVDLLGEGVDVPAIEVVSMARPTQSYGLYSQQFGRALRPMQGKDRAIIIDHVGNVIRHGLPDAPREWSLERRERRSRSAQSDVIPVRTCLNIDCMSVYERTHKTCPFCGFYSPPAQRSAPEFVDGDLFELDAEVLAKLRGEVTRVDSAPVVSKYLDPIIQRSIANRHAERQQAQQPLRNTIALWAGHQKSLGREDSEIYRRFYFQFGIDIISAQALGVKETEILIEKVTQRLAIDSCINSV